MIRRTTVVCDQTGTEEDLASRGELYGQTLYGLPSGWVQFSIDGQSYHFSSSTNATNWIASRASSYPVLLSQSIEDKAPRAVTRVVASSSATEEFKSQADYVCDGVTDEEEINAAIADCISYGGTVVLSDHLFYVSSPVLITGRVDLVGQGQSNSVIIAASGANCDVVQVSGSVNGISLRHLKIDGNNARGGGAGNTAGKGLVLTGGSGVILDDVGVINTAEENIYTASGSVYTFRNVNCSGAGNAASDKVGISMNACSGARFDRTNVVYATGTGILMSGCSDIHCTTTTVDMCNVGATGYGWTISQGNGHLIGCSVGACGSDGVHAGGGLYITGPTSNLIITNFGSRNHYGAGLYALWVAGTDMENVSICNSIFTGSEGYGVYLGGNNIGFEFTGNTVRDNTTYDLVVHSGFEGSGVITNNVIGSGQLVDAAADFSDFVVECNQGYVHAYTVANAPTASSYTGRSIYVSNGAAGSPILAFSNGTNWLRCDTLAAISAS